MLDEKIKVATEYFTQFKGEKDKFTNVWYEPKQDKYFARTEAGEFWQISAGDLAKELAKNGNH